MSKASRLYFLIAVLAAVATVSSEAVFRGSPAFYRSEVALVGYCSGVVIAPQVVLTAWHCAQSASFLTVAGRSVNLPAPRRLHPARDIAYVCLPFQVTVPAVTIAQQPVLVDEEVDVVGFGSSEGDVLRFWTSISQIRAQVLAATHRRTPLIGRSRVTYVQPSHGMFATDDDGPRSRTPSVACWGDSGGPVYRAGTRTLVGITDEYAQFARCSEPVVNVDVVSLADLVGKAVKTCP